MAIGTPAYMSPEQAAGEKDLDGRSDLYALACVLYEMLAGQPPFTGPTVESIVRQHLTATPPPITQLRPAVPGMVAAALERALAKNPADRFNPVGENLRRGRAKQTPISTDTEIFVAAEMNSGTVPLNSIPPGVLFPPPPGPRQRPPPE